MIITSNALPPGQTSVVGGAHGITTTLNDAYGSTDGNPGAVLTTAPATIPGSSSGGECVAALTVTKTTTTPAVTNTSAGTAARYTITVSNGANVSPATGVGIADALPAGFTYATTVGVVLGGGATRPAAVNPAAGAANPTFGTFSIPAAGSVVITFTVNIAASVVPGTYSNPAAATYLDPARTTVSGTASSTYPGGGVERVTLITLAGLPNTSAPLSESGAPAPSLWPATLGLMAVAFALFIAARARIDRSVRFRQRRRRPEFALPIMLSVAVCAVAFGTSQPGPLQPAPSQPAGSVAQLAATVPVSVEVIGDTAVTEAKPPAPVEEKFYAASGAITPSRLRIPSIGVDASVAGVGLLPDGSMAVPNNLWVSAWLSSSARPGQAGNAVIAGHRGIGAPGLFGHLENVRPGDRIHVSDASHAELVYEVTRVASLDLSGDTQMQVFGPTAQRQLVLVTCFGRYSSTTRTYDHRLVVFSRLLPPGS